MVSHLNNPLCPSLPLSTPGVGNGNPLQYSCLENPTDRGAWWITVHGIAESNMTEWTYTYTHTPLSTSMWKQLILIQHSVFSVPKLQPCRPLLGQAWFILPCFPSAITMVYRRDHMALSDGWWNVFPLFSVHLFMSGHVTQDWSTDCEQCLMGKFPCSWKLHCNASPLLFAKQCQVWMLLLKLLVGGGH